MMLLAASDHPPEGPQILILVGIVAIMAVLAGRALMKAQRHPERESLKAMSRSERWHAFKLARSGEVIEHPLDRRLAERFLRYVAATPRIGWKVIVFILGLGVVADLVRQESWQHMVVSRLPLLAFILIGGLLVWRLKRRYRSTAEANGWDMNL